VVGTGTMTGGGAGSAVVVVGATGAGGRSIVVVGASDKAVDAVVAGMAVVVEGFVVVDDSNTRVEVGDVPTTGEGLSSLRPAATERPSTPATPIPASNGQRRFFSGCRGGRAHGSGG
jgi:hypothetical protein